MSNPYTLNVSATLHSAHSDDPCAWSVRVHLPWFRALPLSCIEQVKLSAGDEVIGAEELLIRVDARHLSLTALQLMDSRYWAVGEQLQIGVGRRRPIPPIGSLISVQLTVRMPDTGATVADCARRTATSTTRLAAFPQARWPLGVCTFSFAGELRRGRSLRSCLQEVASSGAGIGVELLGPQVIEGYPAPDPRWLDRLSDTVRGVGLVPIGYDAYIDPGRTALTATDDDIMGRGEIELDVAARLGCSYVRLNVPFRRTLLDRLSAAAQQRNLLVLTELHAVTANDPSVRTLLVLLKELQSPHLGLIVDLSCVMRALPDPFVRDMLEAGSPREAVQLLENCWRDGAPWPFVQQRLAELDADDQTTANARRAYRLFRRSGTSWLPDVLPFTRTIHGKFYEMRDGREPSIAYPDVLSTLADSGFDGHVMSEYEGHLWDEAPDTFGQLRQHHRMLAELSNA